MRVVIDVEANGLENPTKVWVVVCRDIDTGDLHIFRNLTDDKDECNKFLRFSTKVDCWIGHNIIGYDLVVLTNLIGLCISNETVIDTLIVSKMVDYSRDAGHSIEAYGEEFGHAKISFNDFSKYSKEMEDYCIRDVEICHRVYDKYRRIIDDPSQCEALRTEHDFEFFIISRLHRNGFYFDIPRAKVLLGEVEKELAEVDEKILSEFPPREELIREFTPKLTKFGTINKTSVPRSLWGRMSEYEAGNTYRHTRLVPFNPASVKQVVSVLNEAGWKPTDKTKTHVDLEREINRLRYSKSNLSSFDLAALSSKLVAFQNSGWKVNENNLDTLPSSAPPAAKLLAKRILLESRRRTLTEWLSLAGLDSRIHGKFYGIGAWTHRMAHQNPNTANIPGEFKLDGSKKLYGKEMRQLWCAPKNRLLVGVDAEGIQLRIFAHYIDDPEFTDALVRGRKDDKTDPHSLNQRILGRICKSRAAAKRFIYALLLGAGTGKLAEILECSVSEAREALDRLLERYKGFKKLKEEVLPLDGRRGYFIGLDGRKVPIPGETAGTRTHLAMSGYLQCGEAVVMKKACLLWHKRIAHELGGDNPIYLNSSTATCNSDVKIVNFVHDEWQTEVPNDLTIAMRVASIQSESLRIVGEQLGLKCPLAGSYWNDDHKDYTIGVNWYQTH